jgi:hypothetical protein
MEPHEVTGRLLVIGFRLYNQVSSVATWALVQGTLSGLLSSLARLDVFPHYQSLGNH